MGENEAEVNKRTIPCDKPIKWALLFGHIAGFGIWYGGTVLGAAVNEMYIDLVIVSGVLLALREIYKHGFVWLLTTEGVFTIAKMVPLAVFVLTEGYAAVLMTLVLLLGFVGSRLPERRLL